MHVCLFVITQAGNIITAAVWHVLVWFDWILNITGVLSLSVCTCVRFADLPNLNNIEEEEESVIIVISG